MDFVDLLIVVGYLCVLSVQLVVALNLIKQNKELRKDIHYKQAEVDVCLRNMKKMLDINIELGSENYRLKEENKSLSEEKEVLESFFTDVYVQMYSKKDEKKKRIKIKNRDNK